MYKVDALIAISAQLAKLTKKVDSWTTNQIVNAMQIVGPRCNHRGGNHESVDCNEGSPFVQLVEDVNNMHYLLAFPKMAEASTKLMQLTEKNFKFNGLLYRIWKIG